MTTCSVRDDLLTRLADAFRANHIPFDPANGIGGDWLKQTDSTIREAAEHWERRAEEAKTHGPNPFAFTVAALKARISKLAGFPKHRSSGGLCARQAIKKYGGQNQDNPVMVYT